MFKWDEPKRQENLEKHGIDFGDAEDIFGGYTVTAEDTREAYGEPRFLTLGLLHGQVVSVHAHAAGGGRSHHLNS
jgi:uncharacterized DUF497 family protein